MLKIKQTEKEENARHYFRVVSMVQMQMFV